MTPRELAARLGPSEAQYGEPSLTLTVGGAGGVTLACGTTIVDQGPYDSNPDPNVVSAGFQVNNVVPAEGKRFQFDENSATFLVEDDFEERNAYSVGFGYGWDLGGPGSVTHTARVFAHVGHAPGHGATPIAGDVVSNECSVTFLVPAPESLTLGLVGDAGAIPCGSSVVDQDANDTNPAGGTVAVGYAWNDLTGDTGYRQQFDISSATFVTEDLFLESAPATTSGSISRSALGSATSTIRVFGHVGHAADHGATPIAGDVVSNECVVTLTVPGV